jgi:hypothetical protein
LGCPAEADVVTIDDTVGQIQARLGLEADVEHEVLEEIRGHLEEAVAAGVARGLTEEQALREGAAAFGVEETTAELRAAHAGWGTLDGVAAAALPLICALILRWLIFAPDGTSDAWRQILTQPSLAVIAMVVFLVPLHRFSRRATSGTTSRSCPA